MKKLVVIGFSLVALAIPVSANAHTHSAAAQAHHKGVCC